MAPIIANQSIISHSCGEFWKLVLGVNIQEVGEVLKPVKVLEIEKL